MAEFSRPSEQEVKHTSPDKTGMPQPDNKGLVHRIKKFHKEHRVASRVIETAAAVGVLIVAAKVRKGIKTEVPIIKVHENKWGETGIASYLGVLQDGKAKIRDDLSPPEEQAASDYLILRGKLLAMGLPEKVSAPLAFSANLSDLHSTRAAIKRRLQLSNQRNKK